MRTVHVLNAQRLLEINRLELAVGLHADSDREGSPFAEIAISTVLAAPICTSTAFCPYEWAHSSSAARLGIVSVEPWSSISWRRLKSVRVRVTLSRVVPMNSAISS
jgi:hypothetical protein